MIKIKKYISKSEKQTREIAADFLKKIKPGETIGLTGELGAGKTVFVKGLAKALGIKEIITSPTFVILKTYPAKLHGKNIKLHHFDFYRLQNPDLSEFNEYLGQPNSIAVVEWPEHQSQLKCDWLLKFHHLDKKRRQIITYRK